MCNFGDFFVCLQSAGAAGNVAGAATAKEGGASLRPQSDLGTGPAVPKTRRPPVPPPPIMMLSYVTNGDTLSRFPPTKSLSRHAKQQNAHADSYQRGGGHSRKDDSYKYRDNRYFNSNRNQIVFTIYRLIWNQTDSCVGEGWCYYVLKDRCGCSSL